MDRYKVWDRDEVEATIEARRGSLATCFALPRQEGLVETTEAASASTDLRAAKCYKDEIVRPSRRHTGGEHKDHAAKLVVPSGYGARASGRCRTFDAGELRSPTPLRRTIEARPQNNDKMAKSQGAVKVGSPVSIRRKQRNSAQPELRGFLSQSDDFDDDDDNEEASPLPPPPRSNFTNAPSTPPGARRPHSWNDRLERRRAEKDAKEKEKEKEKVKKEKPLNRLSALLLTSSSDSVSSSSDATIIRAAAPEDVEDQQTSSAPAAAAAAGGEGPPKHRRRLSLGRVPSFFNSLSSSLAAVRSPRPAASNTPPVPRGSPALPSSPSSSSPPTTTSTFPMAAPMHALLPAAAVSFEVSEQERREVVGSGDARLYCLLRELQLAKYWPHFLAEEILITDIGTMTEEELVADFRLTKYHARRLVNAFAARGPILSRDRIVLPAAVSAAVSESSSVGGVQEDEEEKENETETEHPVPAGAAPLSPTSVHAARRLSWTDLQDSMKVKHTRSTELHRQNLLAAGGDSADDRALGDAAPTRPAALGRLVRKRSQSAFDRVSRSASELEALEHHQKQQQQQEPAGLAKVKSEGEDFGGQLHRLRRKLTKRRAKQKSQSVGKESGEVEVITSPRSSGGGGLRRKPTSESKLKLTPPPSSFHSGRAASCRELRKSDTAAKPSDRQLPRTAPLLVDVVRSCEEPLVTDRRDSEVDRLDALVRKHRELALDELEWDEERGIISSGMFGRVYKGKWRGVDCAIKELKLTPSDDPEQQALLTKEFRREAALMQALGHHPNCTCFFGAVTVGSRLCLVTEWVPNGSVYDLLIKKRVELPREVLVKIARDAACGILHLHSENVIHRDVAARNVLVSENYTGKIGDLGLSRMVAGVSASLRHYTNSNVGAVKWMSPESIHAGTYSEKSDSYSFGVFLWEMWTRQEPWADLPPLQAALRIAGGSKLATPKDCPRGLAELMAQCMASRPEDRPNFAGIVQALDALLAQLRAETVPRPNHAGTGAAAASSTAMEQDDAATETRESRWRRLFLAGDGDESSDDESSSSSDGHPSDSESEEDNLEPRLIDYTLDRGRVAVHG